VPDATANIIRTGSGTGLSGIASNSIIPLLSLEEPDGFGEETCGYEIEQTC